MARTIPLYRGHPNPREAEIEGQPPRFAVSEGWKHLRDCRPEDLRWHIRQRIALHDADDDFFEMAFSFYGPLIDTALEEMDLPRRCTLCGLEMPHTEEQMATHRASYGHHGELQR